MILSGTALIAAVAVGVTVGLSRPDTQTAAAGSTAAAPATRSDAGPPPPGSGRTTGTATPPVLGSPNVPAPVSSTPKSTKPAAPAGHAAPRVSFGPVTLALPKGWRLGRSDGSVGRYAGCVLAPGQAAAPRLDRCALAVQYVGDHPAGEFFENPDAVGGFMDDASDGCPDGSHWLATKAPRASTSTVDGRRAQVRTLTMDCAGRDVAVQQWAITDHPYVVMTSYLPVGSPLAATVRTIATSAGLPARTGPSRVDFGLIKAVRTDRDGTIITFDREIHMNPFDEYNPPYPADVNENPTTYELRVAPNAVIRAVFDLCGSSGGEMHTSPVDALGGKRCSVSEFATRYRLGTSATVWLTYDVHGKVNGIAEEFRS
jgi:hypothetical protein